MQFGKSSKQYDESVRAFALTLHFYSPRAYGFVRTKFNKHLPDVSVLRSWASNCTGYGEPGINVEALRVIGKKADEMQRDGNNLFCSLAWDEMNIRRHVQWCEATNKFLGYITYGSKTKDGEIPVASQALVFLITGINSEFSIPVAHFFIKGLKTEEKANLIRAIIDRLTSVGAKVINITFDGYANNFSACEHLGASFDTTNMKPYFENRIDGTKIHVTCDPCHMIKLVRNCLGSEKVLENSSGKIEWRFLESLENYRLERNFVTHKVTKKHIQWFRNKMNVRLAVQLFSNSVANSLQYLKDHNGDEFSGSEQTIEFARIMDKWFDLSNSKNYRISSSNICKNPITQATAGTIFEFLDRTATYLKSLKVNGVNVLESRKKTGMANEFIVHQKYHNFIFFTCFFRYHFHSRI